MVGPPKALAAGPGALEQSGRPFWRRPPWGSESAWAMAFAFPYAALFLGLVVYPVAYGLWMARNPSLYRELLADPFYAQAVIMRHSSGIVYLWLMSGTSVIGTGSPGSVSTDWAIQGLGDFNGDGMVDVLWRHTSGAVFIWLMNGTSIGGTGSPGSVDPSWPIQ